LGTVKEKIAVDFSALPEKYFLRELIKRLPKLSASKRMPNNLEKIERLI
jgi:hypothetical protein